MYTIYGNKNYQINSDLIISRKDDEPCGLRIKNNKVNIKLFDIQRVVDIKWLYYVAKFNIKMPEGYEEELFKIEFKDTKVNTNIKTVAVFKEPVYYNENGLSGFRLIARNPMCCINIKGDIYSIKKKKFLPVVYLKKITDDFSTMEKYPMVKIPNNVTIHRLVALTWIHNSDFKKYSMVDHIDGDVNNYNVSNLRWCTPRQNSNYTLTQNIRSDNIPVKIRNIITGDIFHFASVTEASKVIGRSRINNVCASIGHGKIWNGANGRFEMKLESDNTPWYYTENNMQLKLKNNTGMYVIFENNGIIKEYNSISEASKDLLKQYGIIAKMCPDIEKYVKEIYPNSTLTIIEKRKVQAMNLKDKSVIETNTILEMANTLGKGFAKSTITKYIKNKRILNGYVFRYKPFNSNTDWEIDTSESKYKSYTIRVISKDINNNSIIVHDSLRKAALYFSVDKNIIKQCIVNKKLLRNQYELKLENCHL